MSKEKSLSESELKHTGDRMQSDADLLRGGAKLKYDSGVDEPRLEVTPDQIAEARSEMENERRNESLAVIIRTIEADEKLQEMESSAWNSRYKTLGGLVKGERLQEKQNFKGDRRAEIIEQELDRLSVEEMIHLLQKLESDHVYITSSHEKFNPFREVYALGERIDLFLEDPKVMPHKPAKTSGGHLAGLFYAGDGTDFTTTDGTGWGWSKDKESIALAVKGQLANHLVQQVTSGENAVYDIGEEVVLDTEQKAYSTYFGGGTRDPQIRKWLLKKKLTKSQ